MADIDRKKVVDELFFLKKAYNSMITDLPTFENEKDMPEFLRPIIDQYYCAVLVMVPNVGECRNKLYDVPRQQVVFPLTCNDLNKRIKRFSTEVKKTIELYRKLQKTDNENQKKSMETHLKMLEIDMINNVAHMYDIHVDDNGKQELGIKNGIRNEDFSSNFKAVEYLKHNSTAYDKEQALLKHQELIEFIKQSITDLKKSHNIEQRGPIIDNSFAYTFVLGVRANLLSSKSKGMLELMQGDYSVTPILVREEIEKTGRKKKNSDVMLFFGRNAVVANTQWHLGDYGDKSSAQEIDKIPKFMKKDVEKAVTRNATNCELICNSIDIANGDKEMAYNEKWSNLDNLAMLRLSVLRYQKVKDRYHANTYNSIKDSLKMPETNPEIERLYKDIGIDKITKLLETKEKDEEKEEKRR